MKKNLDNMKIHVGDLKSEQDDQIQILDLLTVYASQLDALELTEHEAYLALPKSFSKNALIHYQARCRRHQVTQEQ